MDTCFIIDKCYHIVSYRIIGSLIGQGNLTCHPVNDDIGQFQLYNLSYI